MKTENLDINKYKLTFSVNAEILEQGVVKAYNKMKGKLNVQGFRKGKVPRKVVESTYGKEVFYDDAVNFILPEAYSTALEESKLFVVSKPEIDVVSISAEEGVEFTAIVYTKPEVIINDFKNIEYTPTSLDVSDEELNDVLKTQLEKNARIISVLNRSIESGDLVVLDFDGYIDDVAFEGGKGTDFELEIGSGTFIDTFEDQLISHNINDSFDVNVNFPDNYHSEDLKSKPAVFKVVIKDIKTKELPELDDEFAKDISEFDTLKEYKDSIIVELKENKKANAEKDKETQVMDKLIERAEMTVPEVMIESQIQDLIRGFEDKLKSQGMDLGTYLQYMGQDLSSLKEVYHANAEAQVKGRLVLETIAENEKLIVSDLEIEEELEKMSKAYSMPIENLKAAMRAEDTVSLGLDIKVKKAIDLVLENSKEVK